MGVVGEAATCEASTTEGRTGDIEFEVTSVQGISFNVNWRLGDG